MRNVLKILLFLSCSVYVFAAETPATTPTNSVAAPAVVKPWGIFAKSLSTSGQYYSDPVLLESASTGKAMLYANEKECLDGLKKFEADKKKGAMPKEFIFVDIKRLNKYAVDLKAYSVFDGEIITQRTFCREK